ncbi:MAG: GTPase ObgE [Lentisphaeria bacterium]|nr:GTPase ObgE [Lentisphaeria bacterium]
MFVDKVKVKVRAGSGGNGCSSFRRERNLPKGGPDGGDGGNGGNVIFEANENNMNLNALKYLNHYEADNGEHGKGKQLHGHTGKDVIIYVPPGTCVKEFEDVDNEYFELVFVADLDEHGSRYVAATGGNGGRGNMHFATSRNRAPRKCEEGTLGEEKEFELELKIIADVGLVGYPNAGKSSFLDAVTNATPEMAPYPFTTLTPNIGILNYPEDLTHITIADIPGLIEGASDNVGLGHDFLRHVERTKVLLYVLDMAGTDGREPWDDLVHLQKELELYNPLLADFPGIIAANKMDEEIAEEKLATLRTKTDMEIFPICTILEEGLDPLKAKLKKCVRENVENAS